MSRGSKRRVSVSLDGRDTRVSGLFHRPGDARALYVLAHGAGANMEHPFMSEAAQRLYDNGVATFRYNFPYMEKGIKRYAVPFDILLGRKRRNFRYSGIENLAANGDLLEVTNDKLANEILGASEKIFFDVGLWLPSVGILRRRIFG